MIDLINIEDLYENAPCGYFSFLPNGKIIKANKTFTKWIGISPEELTNFTFLDLLYKGNTIYFEMIFLPTLKMQGFINEINFDIIRKDGTKFPGLINAVAVRDNEHNLQAINVTLINITERKKYENELLLSKKEAETERLKFEILSNQIPDIIWTTNDEGKIEFLNQQYYSATQFKSIGTDKSLIFDLIYQKDVSLFKDKWSHAMENSIPFESEIRLKSKGSKIPDWYLLRAVPYIKDNFSEIKERSWLGTLTNINQQVKSLQLKDDFISIASHELRTPITIVNACLQILQEVVSDETQLKLLEKCENNLDSMNQLIGNLLDITKINSEEILIDKTEENMYSLLKNCINNFHYPRHTHTIELINEADYTYVSVDRMRIEQVINNLLNNAIKYSPGADKVIVRINQSEDPKRITVSVEDFGIGIPKEDQKKIFDRYYRAKTKNYDNIKGWGLGLFIIQQIIKAHNSLIEVKSIPGKGSCFYFHLDTL